MTVDIKKLIKINGSTSELMSFDEVIQQYKNYLYKEANKFSYTVHYDTEEIYQVALIGLWKAYKSYKEDGSVLFLTYAAICIRNEILLYLRKIKKQPQLLSLEATLYTNSEGNEMMLEDLIGEDDSFTDKLAENEILSKIVKDLNERQIEELECLLYKEVKQKELAEKYNTTQTYISRRTRRTLEGLKKQYLWECRDF